MDGGRLRILVVDDDEDDFVMTRDLLSEIGGRTIETDWASTYSDGLRSLCANSHDVYLLDYRLGEKNGVELLKEAVAEGCCKPVILLTGQGDRELDLQAMEAGASDYLVKGQIDASLLERSIRYAIGHKQSEQQIKQMAYYDHLTNLPNRVLFQERLRQGISLAHRYERTSVVLFLDLDNFKRINDTLGHRVGDMLLQGVAERLRDSVRKSDAITRTRNDDPDATIARIGGDEFILLLTEINQPEDAARVAQRIIDGLNRPFVLDGNEVVVTASIGIALFPDDGEDMDTLLKNADIAMYHAKEQGRNGYQFYRNSMNAAALEKLRLENDLRRALARNEFTLFFQPEIDVQDWSLAGLEALIRWNHPERGLVGPLEFIPVAEDSGLILPIGEWVLMAACQQNREWQDAGLPAVPVSVNLSGHQFRQKNFVDVVRGALRGSRLEPRYLILEITESVLMKDTAASMETLKELRTMGVRLSIDDFGTGYSSLSYLKRFPIHSLKIDRSFIKEVAVNADDAAIVTAIIVMGHSLKLAVVAEGVEKKEHADILRTQGCDHMQGYFISKPMPAADVPALFSRGVVTAPSGSTR
jgi:diguanylate cyclase (GGDEF)-like protein